jgi:phosphocarrier protein FPr
VAVGIVVVSHSALLADGVVELAREMGGPEVPLEAAGGLEGQSGVLGTDPIRVQAAIERIWSPDGVVVLVDLGSAVLSAETALELLSPGQRERVVLCSGPLAEGAVTAAAAARAGEPLARVVEEALAGLRAKAEHVGDRPEASPPRSAEGDRGHPVSGATSRRDGVGAGPGRRLEPSPSAGETAVRSLRLTVSNPFGLHARPAARLIEAVRLFDATVTLTNLANGKGPASARSLSELATLGVARGSEMLVEARGPEADAAVQAVGALAARSFGDAEELPPPPEPGATAPEATAAGPVPMPSEPALAGLSVSPGIAIGPARHLRAPLQVAPSDALPGAGRPRAGDAGAGASGVEAMTWDPEAESARLSRALESVGREVRQTRDRITAMGASAEADILSAHLLLLQDERLVQTAERAIGDQGMDAAQAWSFAADAVRAQFGEIEDPYLRSRADDVAGIARRVLEHLGGPAELPGMQGPGILVVPALSPSEAAALDPVLVLGVATATGGSASHAALLVRALGIPCVMGLGDGLLGIGEGTELLLDADAGLLHLHPSDALLHSGRRRMEALASEAERAKARALAPAATRDGVLVEVHANVGVPEAVGPALAAGAAGVGLLRTEFLFLDRRDLPGEREQEAAYRAIAETLAGRPFVLRTLDVGGDKPVEAFGSVFERNPSLGLRGIRRGLAQPEVLATQIRAALRVAADHPVKVMFPLVATLDEYREAVAILERERERLAADGLSPCAGFEVGVMVEVPSLALLADRFAPGVGFFSIGTNDLSQYVLAADRDDERVASLADPLHPSVLRLVRQVVEAARSHGRRVGVCGEAAADVEAVPLLLGLGVDELSVAPVAIPPVKDLIRRLDAGPLRALVDAALGLGSAAEVRRLVSAHLAALEPASS